MQGARMATAATTGATNPSVTPAGSWLYCPARGCCRKTMLTRRGLIGTHPHPWGGGTCAMSGQPVPTGVAVQWPAGQEPTLFDELPELADAFGIVAPGAGEHGSAGPREIPLAEASWGMFGEVKGWRHDGSPATHTGYLTKPPR